MFSDNMLTVGLFAFAVAIGCSSSKKNNDVDAGSDAGGTDDTDSTPDAGGDAQCANAPNFSPCAIATEPDRDYDICIDGYCRSPGCGSHECNAPGPHFPLPDTGQALCYGGSVDPMACPGEAGGAACSDTAYCGQDAQYGWDASHEAQERFTRTEEISGEPIASDNVTGLVWEAAPSGGSRTWSDALAYCDGLVWSGYDDWRLPDLYELMSLVDLSRATPAIDTDIIGLNNGASCWSSTYEGMDQTGLVDRAFAVGFSTGESVVANIEYSQTVLCARGEPTSRPVARFERTEEISGEPIVADASTSLVWQGCLAGRAGADCSGESTAMTWTEALAYCESLSWSGFDDWRLPNRTELWSLVDTRQQTPGIDPTAFPESQPSAFIIRSSTTDVHAWDTGNPDDADPARAWSVAFVYPSTQSAPKAEGTGTGDFWALLGVRCVRGGI